MRRLLSGLALTAAVFSLAAAPAGHTAHHAANKQAPRTWVITIAQMAYGPAPAGMRVGDTVQWVNHDIFLHSATANDHSFDVNIPVHGAGQTRLTHAGIIPYTCRYHPGMKGQLVVAN
jgi:plastocyanin